MPISRKILHQLIACTPAICAQILIGVGWGWTAPTLKNLQNGQSEFTITSTEASWLASICEIGRILGPFVAPLLLDYLGRKKTLIIVSVVYLGVWAATIFVRNIYLLLAIRVAFGIGNGVTDVASSIYVTEICSPDFRGISGSVILIAFYVGLITEHVVTTYLTFTNAAIVNTVLALLALGSQYFGVETTYYLTMKGKHQEARDNFIWLQVSPHHADIEHELLKIRNNVEEEKHKRESIRTLFSSTVNLKAMFAAVGFYLLFSSAGYHTMTPYSSLIFAPSETFTSNHYTIMYGIGQFTATVVSFFFVEKVDRRPVIIYSYALISLFCFGGATLMYLHGQQYDIVLYPWLLFICLACYGFIGSSTFPVVYIITSELLPLSVRSIGGCLAVAASSLASFVTAILFWPITHNFGMEYNFIIFAVMSMLVTIFVYVYVPETRGKALHEMYAKSTDNEKCKELLAPLNKKAYDDREA